jgi:ATP-dependent Clp protease ATP-binding subunit ClpA
MFERFTQAARAVVVDAQSEARRLGHPTIGTEHLLLALLRGDSGRLLADAGVTAARIETTVARLRAATPGALGPEDAAALRAIGIDLDEVRARIEENFGPVPLEPPAEPPRRRRFGLRRRPGTAPTGRPAFSPRAKKVLELALREALRLQQAYIADEHILLGLLREDGGLGARVLADAGVDAGELRRRAEASLRGRAA